MPSQIYFRAEKDFKKAFMGAIKSRGLTIEDVLRPFVEEYIKNPDILDKLTTPVDIDGKATRLTEDEREILQFIRSSGKSEGSKGEIETSVLRDFRRWIKVLREMK